MTESLGMAPVAARGNVQTAVVNRKNSNGSSEIAATTTGNVNFQSYIWHPWFATVAGDVTLGYDFSTGDRSSTSSVRASGDAKLDILPQSRYPISLSVGHSESRISGDFVSGDSTRDFASIGARAVIMPGLTSGFRARWDRTERPGSGVRTGIHTNLNLDKTFTAESAFLGIKEIGFQADFQRDDFTAADEENDDSVFDNANVRLSLHSELSENLAIDSRLSATFADFSASDGDETRLSAQGLTTMRWRPEDLPLTVTGALRTSWQDVSQVKNGEELGRTTSIASLNIGARWPVNDNLALNVGVRASYSDTERDQGIDLEEEDDDDGARVEGGFLLGATYNSDRHEIADFNWRWSAGFQTNNGFDTEDGFESTESISLGHQVDRRFDSIFFWPVQFSATQALDLTVRTSDEEDPFSSGITHSVSLGYNRADRDSASFGRLSIRDSRRLIGEQREFQSVQLRFGERVSFDRDRRLSGNVNARTSRSVNDEGDSNISSSLSAELNYEHNELFEVRGLAFRSTLRMNVLDVGALFGAGEESRTTFEALSNDWRNILLYRIGQLSAEAEASAFHRDDAFGYVAIIRLRRQFGGRL